MRIHFLDNTDPDGFDKTFDAIERLATTLTLVVSKSGGTKETRNGMLEAQARYERAGLNFAEHAVAVTGAGSELDQVAVKGGWLRRFPMWDWVGGRTSVMSAVGLVPMALQGLDIDQFLAGAAAMDEKTRIPKEKENAAMLLALMWHYAGKGKGEKDMVILPYKDRLVLFSKYLQQLVMESLGKERDLDGQHRPPGHRRVWQQRLHRPARLRAAVARGRAEFLRHLHRGAKGPGWRTAGSRARRHRAAITSRASCAAPARPSTKTAATP